MFRYGDTCEEVDEELPVPIKIMWYELLSFKILNN